MMWDKHELLKVVIHYNILTKRETIMRKSEFNYVLHFSKKKEAKKTRKTYTHKKNPRLGEKNKASKQTYKK